MEWYEKVEVRGGGNKPTTHRKVIDRKVVQDYLDNTDWYIVRKMEKGIDVPEEVVEKREFCRGLL
jgi:hypothetical protein